MPSILFLSELYYKYTTVINDTSKVIRMMIISDTLLRASLTIVIDDTRD